MNLVLEQKSRECLGLASAVSEEGDKLGLCSMYVVKAAQTVEKTDVG